MGKRLDFVTEEKIVELSSKGIKKDKIAEMLKVSRRSVFYVLKKYRFPDNDVIKKENKTSILDLISFRLLYYCEDYDLLKSMFESAFFTIKPKEIYIPKKIIKLVEYEKIKKITNIVQKEKNLMVK